MRRIVLLVLLLTACTEPRPAADNAAALEAVVDTLLPRIEQLSGMQSLRPVRIERRSATEVRAYVEGQIADELPPERLDAIRRTYALLGLVPDTLDMRALLLDLYTEQIVGYYHPGDDVLYVVDSVPVDALTPVVTHELVHALQDQRADLDSLISPARGNDRQMAAQAALEGHATLIMFALLATDSQGNPADPLTLPNPAAQLRPALQSPQSQFPVFRRAPRIIQETLLFPYIAGSAFVQALWSTQRDRPAPLGDWLPQSTEQLLHFERAFLAARDEPAELRFADMEGRVLYENSFGELETRLLFEQHLGRPDSVAANGWDGDRYRLIEGYGTDILLWASVWDDAASADRFVDALGRVASRLGLYLRIDRLPLDSLPAVYAVLARDSVEVTMPPACIVTDPSTPSC